MTTTPLTDQQLADIRSRHERTTHPGWRSDTDLGRVLAELDRLRADGDALEKNRAYQHAGATRKVASLETQLLQARAELAERTQLLVNESSERERAQAERDQARAELTTAKAAGYRQAADNATEMVQLHGRDADAEMLLVFLQRGAELRERFAAAQTAGES